MLAVCVCLKDEGESCILQLVGSSHFILISSTNLGKTQVEDNKLSGKLKSSFKNSCSCHRDALTHTYEVQLVLHWECQREWERERTRDKWLGRFNQTITTFNYLIKQTDYVYHVLFALLLGKEMHNNTTTTTQPNTHTTRSISYTHDDTCNWPQTREGMNQQKIT